jgi:hypothetical protein
MGRIIPQKTVRITRGRPSTHCSTSLFNYVRTLGQGFLLIYSSIWVLWPLLQESLCNLHHSPPGWAWPVGQTSRPGGLWRCAPRQATRCTPAFPPAVQYAHLPRSGPLDRFLRSYTHATQPTKTFQTGSEVSPEAHVGFQGLIPNCVSQTDLHLDHQPWIRTSNRHEKSVHETQIGITPL